MANNRMWLVHRPSGERIRIGKSMDDGWYSGYGFSKDALNAFFSKAHASQEWPTDDFILELEHDANAGINDGDRDTRDKPAGAE